ncbi:chalcone isomerase family protein [Comamonadaceae bacterium G21597-S1]|nr:chalcone isomerase family protein [Comamonadaceae bacterium G21597-S1]
MTDTDRPLGAGRPMPAGAAVTPRGVHRRQALLAVATMVFGAGSGARASVAPAEVRTALPSAVLSGSTRFTYWGFSVYDASLWVLPGFDPREFERHRFALHLQYLRNFTNAAITERSVDEMSRQSGATPERRALWRQWLRNAFPDVRAGDRITGVNQPGEGAVFLTNGRQTGSIPDPAFARLFFGIWLGSDTSEPAMRTALLSGKGGS